MRTSNRAILAICSLAALGGGSVVADVTGKVTFDGDPPARVPLKAVANDPAFAKLYAGDPPLSEQVVVGPARELANAVVYLSGDLTSSAPDATVHMGQMGGIYYPHVVSATVGQKLMVTNHDDVLHNNNVKSAANKSKCVAQPSKGTADVLPTGEAEFYQVACNVHFWMTAWVAVLPNRYHAVTTAEGTFSIDATDLADGEYDVAVWHEKYKDACATGRVTVKDGKGAVDLVVKPKPPAAPATQPTALSQK